MTFEPYILAIPGLRDDKVNPTWPWRFKSAVAKLRLAVEVDAHHYKAKPLPRWNKLIVEPPLSPGFRWGGFRRDEKANSYQSVKFLSVS